MGVKDFFAGLIGPAAEAYKARVEAKNRLKLAVIEAEIKAEQAWAEWRVKNISADEAWEQASIANSGWKDEATWIVLSIPLVLVFVPQLSPYVLTGFEVLDQTPDWYRWLVIMVYAATYGIRVWRRELKS